MSRDGTGRESPLKRWSRLKQAERDRPHGTDGAATEAKPPAVLPGEQDGASPPAPELPDIESLDKDSDFTAFLKDEVPEALQRLALRKLWLSDPVLANLDGLNDYDEDYGLAFRTVQEAVRTIFKVGEDSTEPVRPEGDDAAGTPGGADALADGEESDSGGSPDPEASTASADDAKDSSKLP